MAKADDILKKYGITLVRESEGSSNTAAPTTSSTKETSTGVAKADGILAKYGITLVRGNADNFDQWKRDSNDIISRITTSGTYDDTSRSRIYNLMASGSRYRDQYKDDDEVTSYIDDLVSRLGQAERHVLNASKRVVRVDSPVEDWDLEAGKKGWKSYTERQAQKQQAIAQEAEEKPWWEKMLGYLGDVQDTTMPMGSVPTIVKNVREDTSYMEPSDEWTDDERYIFGYLYDTDRDQAYSYAANVNEAISAEKEAKQIKAIQEDATGSEWKGAAHTAGALLSAPLGLADYLEALVYANAGRPISDNGIVTPFEYSQAVTGGISQDLNEKHGTLSEKIPVIGGKGWGDVYGLGTSIAQSSLAAYTGGGAQALVTFFGSAAASGVDDAKQRGATDEQAIAYGTMSGAAEALAEMVGVDNLLNIGSSATMRQLVMNIVKQGIAEGSEEGITTLMNNFADQLVMQDKSNFNILVQQYMANGLSESDAKKKAWLDMANDMAFDMVSGFASGAIHAGPQTAYETYLTGREMKTTHGGSQQELVEHGLESAEGSLSHELATKYQEKLNLGKDLSGMDLSRLVQANEQQYRVEDMATIQSAAETRLTELGETGDVSAIAAALTKQAAGEKLSRTEQQLITSSKYGQRVANELNTENIHSGAYSSAWAESLDTQRINVEEYSRLVEAAQQPQETAENTVDMVAPQAPKAAAVAQAEPVESPAATVPANDQQMTGKLAAEHGLVGKSTKIC